jgi:hypothetical protein
MPGLVPGIHVLACPGKDVDGRVKPGHDGVSEFAPPIFILHCGKKLAHSELPGNF